LGEASRDSERRATDEANVAQRWQCVIADSEYRARRRMPATRVPQDDELSCTSRVSDRPPADLAAIGTGVEPADLFDPVMLSNGPCIASEAVALSRSLGRDLVPADLGPDEPTAARFSFDCDTLAGRARHLGIGRPMVGIARGQGEEAGSKLGCTSTSPDLHAFYLEACGFEPTSARLRNVDLDEERWL
jgi:hypothetical protein